MKKKINYNIGILDFNIKIVDIIKRNKKNKQFIFFSGIGVDIDIDSKRSKVVFETEKYIHQNLQNSVIIRSGIIIGGGDKFFKSLLRLFKISFFVPLFGNGKSKFQPVFVDDVALGINKIIEDTLLGNNIFEFVGSKIFTYKELYNYISFCLGFKRVFVPVPFIVAKIVFSILDKTPFSPLNSEQLKLFKNDNVASSNYKTLLDLGINPQDLKEIIKKIIKKNC